MVVTQGRVSLSGETVEESGSHAFLRQSRKPPNNLSMNAQSVPPWLPGRRFVLIGLGALSLLGVLTVAILHAVITPSRAATSSALSRSPASSRPPLTRAEEAYIHALWPIHGDVERSAVRMSLGQIFYKTKDISGPQLKARIDEALATYRQAQPRLLALEPPPSLQSAHEQYLAAVRLFEKSALEVLKMFDDGRDDHLLAAYPLNQEGSDKIREIGVKFWPGEFLPN
jgi:hypothetical protein